MLGHPHSIALLPLFFCHYKVVQRCSNTFICLPQTRLQFPFLFFFFSCYWCFPPRHPSAHEREQTYSCVPQGTLFQGVDVLRRATAVATGDRAADGENLGRQVGASSRRGETSFTYRRGQVGGITEETAIVMKPHN